MGTMRSARPEFQPFRHEHAVPMTVPRAASSRPFHAAGAAGGKTLHSRPRTTHPRSTSPADAQPFRRHPSVNHSAAHSTSTMQTTRGAPVGTRSPPVSGATGQAAAVQGAGTVRRREPGTRSRAALLRIRLFRSGVSGSSWFCSRLRNPPQRIPASHSSCLTPWSEQRVVPVSRPVVDASTRAEVRARDLLPQPGQRLAQAESFGAAPPASPIHGDGSRRFAPAGVSPSRAGNPVHVPGKNMPIGIRSTLTRRRRYSRQARIEACFTRSRGMSHGARAPAQPRSPSGVGRREQAH